MKHWLSHILSLFRLLQVEQPITFFFHCGVPQVKKIEDEDEMFDAVIAAVSAAALSSVAILNVVTNI